MHIDFVAWISALPPHPFPPKQTAVLPYLVENDSGFKMIQVLGMSSRTYYKD